MAYVLFIVVVAGGFAALGRKWDFRSRVVVPWTVAMLAAGGVGMAAVQAVWPGVHAVILWGFGTGVAFGLTLAAMLLRFYRDPERTPPDEDRIIVSPADGRIVYVKHVSDGTFPFAVKKGRRIPIREFTSEDFPAEAFVHVGIEMTYLDVHVNRAPIDATVARLVSIPGVFRSLRLTEALLENERVYTLLRGADLTLGMLQIASRTVRRIIPFVSEGDSVSMGQRMGAIRFGSQVDLLIPTRDSLEVLVSYDDDVRAGETILARY